MFRLILATSSTFTDYPLFRDKLDHLLQNQGEVELCTGFSKAGDALAAQYAAERPVTIKVFDPGFRGMYRALVYAEAACFFHDGVSAGISKYIQEARDCRLKVKVVMFEAPKFDGGKLRREDSSKLSPPPDGIVKRDTVKQGANNELDAAIPSGRPRKRGEIVVAGETLIPEKKAKAPQSKKLPVPDPSWKIPYQQAHEKWFSKEYPHGYKDGNYIEPNYPDPRTTNGITAIVINHLKHCGHYSNRQNVQGRQIGGITKTASGATFDDRKWIKSSTRKGASDIVAAINGKMIAIEVKNANTKDTMRDNQVKEQKRVQDAGALYVVITSVTEFFSWYQKYLDNNPLQSDLF